MDTRAGRILNVNDDESLRYAVTHAFQRAGFDVLEAASGEEALRQLNSGPDLVLLDVKLPDMHGFEVCRRIKAATEPAWLPVLFLSAVYVSEADQAAGLESGGDGYLIQPSDPSFLIATVRSILRAKFAEAELREANATLEEAVRKRTAELESANAALREEMARRTEVSAALRQTEHRHRFQSELLGAVGQALIATDLEGTIYYWNRVAEEMYGWSADEALRQPITLVVPQDAQGDAEAIMARLRQGQRWTGEFSVQRRDGSRFPALVTTSPVYDAHGELSAIIGVSVDISERKQAEEALRDSEQRFRAVFDEAGIGKALVDMEGRPYRTNGALQQMLGYSAEELCGISFRDLTHPEDRSIDWSLFQEMLAGKRDSYHIEKRFHAKDGRLVWAHVTGSLIRREDGSPWFLLGMVEDITERKQLEAQFHQAQKMEAVGRLAGGVAHDMNNLLCVITGYSDLLLQNLPSGELAQQSLSQVRLAAERATELTQQLLTFSRKQLLNPRVADPNELIRNTDRMLRRLIGEDVELVTLLDPGVGRIKVDPGQFDQVLMNLAVNARDAMPNGGKLVIETRAHSIQRVAGGQVPPGTYAQICMSDTGVGMPPEVLEQIWEPFFTTKELGKGTGLGLATVYGIIRQSGGYVEVESGVGKGSAFRIYLPTVQEGTPAAAANPAAATPRGTETILLCEDEPMVRKLVRGVLEGTGYKVLEAIHGDAALRLAAQYPDAIHLLVSDVVMPGGVNGRELADRLVRERPRLKVLLMSGYPGENLSPHQITAGNTPFLQKPFTPSTLAARVREVLDQT